MTGDKSGRSVRGRQWGSATSCIPISSLVRSANEEPSGAWGRLGWARNVLQLVFTMRKAGFKPFPSFLESLCSSHCLCPPLEPVRGSQQCFLYLLMTLGAPPNNYPADLSGVSLLKLHSLIFSPFSFYIFAGERDNSSPRLLLPPGLAWAPLVSRTSN